MMDTLFARVAMALARHLVTAIAAILVAHGLADPALADTASGPLMEIVAGAIGMAISLGWSALSARLAHLELTGAERTGLLGRLMHHLRGIILVALGTTAAACATIPAAPERVAQIERVYGAYQRIRALAAIAEPFLSDEAQAAISAAEVQADRAFAAARIAESAAEQIEALRDAEAAAAAIAQAASPSDDDEPLPAIDPV